MVKEGRGEGVRRSGLGLGRNQDCWEKCAGAGGRELPGLAVVLILPHTITLCGPCCCRLFILAGSLW